MAGVHVFVRVGIEDGEHNIDRAQRIGKSYCHRKLKKKCKSLIITFISVRYYTKAYRQKQEFRWWVQKDEFTHI